jgi:hypothetical protein
MDAVRIERRPRRAQQDDRRPDAGFKAMLRELGAEQERTVRISRQAAVVDSISIELVRGILEGVVQLIATFVPREREVEALNALYDWQASLLPGVVRL